MKGKIFILVVTTLFLVSCAENATDSSLQPETEPIHVSGALNSKFEASQSLLNKRITESGDDLLISVHGTSEKNDFRQRISLKFELKVDRLQNLRSGDIFEISDSSRSNKLTYQSHWDESTFTDLLFEIDGGNIRIENSDHERLSGRFKLWAHQTAGRRMTHGQVEDLILSNQGEISISGVFSCVKK